MTTITISAERLLGALEDPENFDDYLGWGFYGNVREVADALRSLMEEDEDPRPITLDFECDSEGIIDGATVGLEIANDSGRFFVPYLIKRLEVKDLTDDRTAKGADSAVAIKDALLYAYNDLRSFAEEKGLI